MAAIARTIIILLNYLVVYHAYGAFEGSVRTKKRYFFPAKNPVDARREVVGGELGLRPCGVRSQLLFCTAKNMNTYVQDNCKNI